MLHPSHLEVDAFMRQRTSRTSTATSTLKDQVERERVDAGEYNRACQCAWYNVAPLQDCNRPPPPPVDHPDGAIEYAPPALYEPKLPLPAPSLTSGPDLGKKYEKFLQCRPWGAGSSSIAWSRSCSSRPTRQAKGGGGQKSDHRVRGVPSGPPALAGRNAGSGRPSQHRSRPAPAPA